MALRIIEGPHVSHPMNATGGLYMQVLSDTGRATALELLQFCAPHAEAHGYAPGGKGTLGWPCQHGIVSCTYAVWFHDKRTDHGT